MSLPSSLRAAATVLLLAAPLALSACGTSENDVPASLAVPVGNGSPIGGTSTPTRGGISTSATFVGTVMTSGGFTLYRNTKDRTAPPASTCTGPCAASWPPVLTDGQPSLDGVDPTLMGTVVRPDGSKQLTVAGWPVYRYAKDMVPGIVNGQGVGGIWLAIGPDGGPLASPAKPAPTKAPAPKVAPKVIPAPTKAPAAPKAAQAKAPTVAPTTVVRDAPGTSSTD